jgi:GNAT superfamily N-acetyltransferase
VGSIFVRPAHRRRGIARALMLAAFDAFWKNDLRRIITDTDANSFTDSTRLYKGLGMKPYRSEFTYEKEIRPGKEVRQLEI